MIKGSTKGVYNHPVDKVWSVTSKFDGISQWFSVVQKVVATGNDQGAQRTCTAMSPDGKTFDIVERLDSIDHTNHTMTVTVLKTLPPFQGLVADMIVRKHNENKSEVEWSYRFDGNGMPETEAKKMTDSIFVILKNDLDRYLENDQSRSEFCP